MGKKLNTTSRRDRELEVLYRISQATMHQHDITPLLNEVLDIMDTEFGLSRGTLTLLRPDDDVYAIEASRGLTSAEQKKGLYHLGEGITGRVAKAGKSMVVADITKDANFLNRTQTRSNQKIAFLCVPIIHGGKVIGTMSIDQPAVEAAQLRRDIQFLELVASLLAEAVGRIRQDIEEREGLRSENRRLQQPLDDRYHPSNLIGKCNRMRLIYEQIA
ncbi:MAG: GAF domain-containing protein, partial [Kiritimatiellae bacterium]|nr:GAF domain-containing protein [Kiritimatiellia bacterium]